MKILKIPDMKILKTFIAIVFGLFAMTTTAANDIANFNRYANDNKRIMELPNT